MWIALLSLLLLALGFIFRMYGQFLDRYDVHSESKIEDDKQ